MTIFIPVFFIDDYTKTKMAFDENELILVIMTTTAHDDSTFENKRRY